MKGKIIYNEVTDCIGEIVDVEDMDRFWTVVICYGEWFSKVNMSKQVDLNEFYFVLGDL